MEEYKLLEYIGNWKLERIKGSDKFLCLCVGIFVSSPASPCVNEKGFSLKIDPL